jgi:hypothetical protein
MVDDLPPGSSRAHRRGTIVLLLAIIVACTVLIVEQWLGVREQKQVGLSWSPDLAVTASSSDRERITGYVGSAACGECHPGEGALFARSGHHRTLWPAEPGRNPVVAWLEGKTWQDPEFPEVTWSYHLRNGRLVVERAIGNHTEALRLEYGLGSGTHGVTFVAIQPGYDSAFNPSGIAHRLSYFATSRRLGITPGQERSGEDHAGPDPVSFGKRLEPERLRQCIGCHSTLTSTADRGRLEPATLIPNVSCERCHGPGRPHIEAARRGDSELTMDLGHQRVEPLVEVARCGECHRLPQALSASDIRPDNLRIVRFQSVGLSVSSCYANGLSGLRCVSCHDPHDRVSNDRAAYASVCLQCHQSGSKPKSKQAACSVSPTSGCIECHMPRRAIAANGLFTDHWIRKPDRPAQQGDAVGKRVP